MGGERDVRAFLDAGASRLAHGGWGDNQVVQLCPPTAASDSLPTESFERGSRVPDQEVGTSKRVPTKASDRGSRFDHAPLGRRRRRWPRLLRRTPETGRRGSEHRPAAIPLAKVQRRLAKFARKLIVESLVRADSTGDRRPPSERPPKAADPSRVAVGCGQCTDPDLPIGQDRCAIRHTHRGCAIRSSNDRAGAAHVRHGANLRTGNDHERPSIGRSEGMAGDLHISVAV